MAWCPKCESEYVDGVTICVDCGCELTESLRTEGEEEEEQSAAREQLAAKEMFFAMDEQLVEMMKEQEAAEAEEPAGYTYGYQNNAERAQENRSSAYVLLVVGVIGAVGVLLLFFDKLPIAMNPFNRYMTSGIMGVMFLLFIAMGIISMKNSKIFEKKAKTENNLTGEIKKWCLETLNMEQLDAGIFTAEEDSLEEEIKYFRRFDEVKRLVNHQFLNLDQAYLDHVIDEVYPEIFQ